MNAGIRSAIVERLTGNLSCYKEKNGGMIFLNGLANWQSFKKTVDKYEMMAEAVGGGLQLQGYMPKTIS